MPIVLFLVVDGKKEISYDKKNFQKLGTISFFLKNTPKNLYIIKMMDI
jgi:5-deoxy-D-glucuronate isomerase